MVEAFLAREPAPEQRVEIAVARLCEMFAAAHRDPKSGARMTVRDFLPYLKAWDEPAVDRSRYSEVDLEVLSTFGVKVH